MSINELEKARQQVKKMSEEALHLDRLLETDPSNDAAIRIQVANAVMAQQSASVFTHQGCTPRSPRSSVAPAPPPRRDLQGKPNGHHAVGGGGNAIRSIRSLSLPVSGHPSRYDVALPIVVGSHITPSPNKRDGGAICLRIRGANGVAVDVTRKFFPTDLLRTVVHEYLREHCSTTSVTLSHLKVLIPLSTVQYDYTDMGQRTLASLNISSKATLILKQ